MASGWYVPAEVDPSATDQRVVEAAVRLGLHGAVTGWAALHWRGARWFSGAGAGGPRPVVLATGGCDVREVPGVVVSKERLNPREIEVVDGLRVTPIVRSVLFEMRYAPSLAAAVRVLDMACYSDLVSIQELVDYGTKRTSWTGIPLAREAWPLADENAWSPPEVDMRLLWPTGAGWSQPLTNRPLFDDRGRHLVTPDLIDPVVGLVGEYDGMVHLDRASRGRDVRRDDLYRRLGLEQVTMTGVDLADPGAVLARLHAAARRAASRPSYPRAWTLDPPPWWTPTSTVAQRRALSQTDRTRLLRHRAA